MQVLDLDCFKTDHRAVLAVLSLRSRQHTAKPGVNVRGWETKLYMAKCGHRGADRLEELEYRGDSKGAQVGGDRGDDWDRTGAQNSSVAKEARRTGRRASRAAQTLPRNLERTESTDARKNCHQDQ